jgi:hypothetical protein
MKVSEYACRAYQSGRVGTGSVVCVALVLLCDKCIITAGLKWGTSQL